MRRDGSKPRWTTWAPGWSRTGLAGPGPVWRQGAVEHEERPRARRPGAHPGEEEVSCVELAVLVTGVDLAVDREGLRAVVVDLLHGDGEVRPVGLAEVGQLELRHPVEVLADVRRPVALVVEPLGQQPLEVVVLGEHPVAAVGRWAVADGQVVVRQLAGEERGPGGAAQGVGAEGVGEGHARSLEPSYGRQEAQLVRAHVVGQHHDDVRLRLRGGSSGRSDCGGRAGPVADTGDTAARSRRKPAAAPAAPPTQPARRAPRGGRVCPRAAEEGVTNRARATRRGAGARRPASSRCRDPGRTRSRRGEGRRACSTRR